MPEKTMQAQKPVRILIAGVNSYIGCETERYLNRYNSSQGRECYRIDKISVRDDAWRGSTFAGYDTILQMAGIAHADVGKVTEEGRKRYYAVNCDLAVEVAKKAKADGVRQFIYMSSVIVYGESAGVGGEKQITADTGTAPANFYGDSKVKAEQALLQLADESFQVAIVRAPMVYGRGSKGNFAMLQKLAEKLPVFPTISNSRSMIYIENLAEFLRLLADSRAGGIYFPQNAEYVSTADMVSAIATAEGRKIWRCPLLNPFVKLASRMPGKIGKLTNKAFGSLCIDRELSSTPINGYCRYTMEESIRRICGGY